jgi:aspartate aminotransferase
MDISKRGRDIQFSPIRKLNPYADKAKEQGIHVYHLNIGQPDIPTPQPILDAFHSFDEKILSYGPAQGFLELRQAIADYFNSYRISLDAENVIITIGGSEAIHFSFSVVADPGDEIIISEPFYTNYNGFASFANVRIVPLTLHVEDGFRLPPEEEIEARITEKTKAILLCSPNNPTGTV